MNAVASPDEETWSLPISPAFDPHEVEVVVDWVESGGSLLLVANHIPFRDGVDALARALGVEFLKSSHAAVQW